MRRLLDAATGCRQGPQFDEKCSFYFNCYFFCTTPTNRDLRQKLFIFLHGAVEGGKSTLHSHGWFRFSLPSMAFVTALGLFFLSLFLWLFHLPSAVSLSPACAQHRGTGVIFSSPHQAGRPSLMLRISSLYPHFLNEASIPVLDLLILHPKQHSPCHPPPAPPQAITPLKKIFQGLHLHPPHSQHSTPPPTNWFLQSAEYDKRVTNISLFIYITN